MPASLILKTGRQETLNAYGLLSGTGKIKGSALVINNISKMTTAEYDLQMLLGTVSARCDFEINEDIPFTPRYRKMVYLSVANGIGDSDSQSIDTIVATFPAELTVDMSGTWEMSVDAEEFVEITHRPEDEPGGQIDTASLRPLYEIRHFWKRKLGGTCSITATSGGLTATASGTIGAGEDTEISWFSELEVSAEAGSFFTAPDGYYDETYALTGTFNGNALTSPFSASETGASASCAAGVSVRVFPSVSPNNLRTAGCTLQGRPPRSYELTGRLRAMDLPYPEDLILLFTRKVGEVSVPVTISGGSGQFTDTATQENYASSATLNGNVYTGASVDTRNEISFRVKPTGADSLGDNSERGEEFGWYHGWPYEVMDMAHADHYLVDDGSSLTPMSDYPGEWSNGENTTVTLDGGAVKIVVGGGTGRTRREFTVTN